MISNDKELRQVENLLKALNKASFPEMVGEEHLALAAAWMWLRGSAQTYVESKKEKEKGPKEVKDKIQKSPKVSKKKAEAKK